MEPTIQLAKTDDEIAATFGVMRQLRTHLTETEYVARVNAQQREAGYRLAVLKADEVVAALAGFRITSCLAWGRHVYVDDLVSDEGTRSHGHGAALMKWVGRYGKAQGCVQLHLDSGVQRHGAHRFYLLQRMDITCYHFCKNL